MDKYSNTSNHRSKSNCNFCLARPFSDAVQPATEEDDECPQPQQCSSQTGLRCKLDVIVVREINEVVRWELLELREDVGECPQPPTEPWMLQDHGEGIMDDVQPEAGDVLGCWILQGA